MMNSTFSSFSLASWAVMSVSFWSNTCGSPVKAMPGVLDHAQRRVAAGLAPAGGVMHQADAGQLLALDVVDHELRLDAVIQADAEDVVLRFLGVAADDHLRGGQRHHQGDFLFLRDVDDGQGDAGIGRADDGADAVPGDQAGDVFHALGGLGFVVVDGKLDLLALVSRQRR